MAAQHCRSFEQVEDEICKTIPDYENCVNDFFKDLPIMPPAILHSLRQDVLQVVKKGKMPNNSILHVLDENLLCDKSESVEDWRFILPVAENLISRYNTLKQFYPCLSDALGKGKSLFLGGVGSKFLFIRQYLTDYLKIRLSVFEMLPFEASFDLKACLVSLVKFIDVKSASQLKATSTPRMFDKCIRKALQIADHKQILLVIHTAEHAQLSQVMPNLFLKLAQDFDNFQLLCTFDDLRWPIQADIWEVPCWEKAICFKSLHTLLDFREEIWLECSGPNTSTSTAAVFHRLLEDIFRSDESESAEEEAMDYEPLKTAEPMEEKENVCDWSQLLTILKNRPIEKLRTFFHCMENVKSEGKPDGSIQLYADDKVEDMFGEIRKALQDIKLSHAFQRGESKSKYWTLKLHQPEDLSRLYKELRNILEES